MIKKKKNSGWFLIYIFKITAFLSIFTSAHQYQLLPIKYFSFNLNRPFLFWGNLALAVLPPIKFIRKGVTEPAITAMGFPSFKIIVSVCFFYLPMMSLAQDKLSGTVYSAKDSIALSAVSVYFDGTSIGTSTNSDGKFAIERYKGKSTPLIISYMGHETVMVNNISENMDKLPPIYLKEKAEELAEVVIEPDPWSRKKKLSIFLKEFLGNSPEAKKSRIKNEKALKLFYSPSTEILTAEASEPLIIVNRFLGYKIEYTLESFKVEFSSGTSGIQFTNLVFYEGFSYFQELRKKPRKKIIENREQTYLGSSLHFMRALSKRKLTQNRFRIFHGKFEAPPYKHFDIQKHQDFMKIELLKEKVSILYQDLEQSALQAKAPFFIDRFGNHTPPHMVVFSGKMSKSRIAHLLPLNYNPKN